MEDELSKSQLGCLRSYRPSRYFICKFLTDPSKICHYLCNFEDFDYLIRILPDFPEKNTSCITIWYITLVS